MNDSFKAKYLANPNHYVEQEYESLWQRLIAIERIYAKGVPKFEYLFSFMAASHEKLGLLAYFVRGNKQAFKLHWSIASKLRVCADAHSPDSESYVGGVFFPRNRSSVRFHFRQLSCDQ